MSAFMQSVDHNRLPRELGMMVATQSHYGLSYDQDAVDSYLEIIDPATAGESQASFDLSKSFTESTLARVKKLTDGNGDVETNETGLAECCAKIN